MKLKLYLMLLFYTWFAVSCVENKDLASCKDQLPKTHRNDVNTTLQIIVPSHLNTFKTNDHIVIVVENLSQDMIDVSPGIDLKFYWLQGDKWFFLENQVDHLSVTDQIFPKTSNDPGGMIYTGIFEMPEYQKPIQICITVEGVKSSSSSSPNVAAFTEITLEPYGKLRDNIYHDRKYTSQTHARLARHFIATDAP